MLVVKVAVSQRLKHEICTSAVGKSSNGILLLIYTFYLLLQASKLQQEQPIKPPFFGSTTLDYPISFRPRIHYHSISSIKMQLLPPFISSSLV